MLTSLLLVATSLAAAAPPAGTQLTYRGSLASADVEKQATTRKTFELTTWLTGAEDSASQIDWLLEERGQGQCPWPDRFGRAQIGAQGQVEGDAPALQYEREDGRSRVPLMLPNLPAGQPLAADVHWEIGNVQLKVTGQSKRGERDVWEVALSDPFGPKGTVWLDARTALVVAAQQRVVMGRGDEYRLKLELASEEQLEAGPAAQLAGVLNALINLRRKLVASPRGQEIELKAPELKQLAKELPALKTASTGTALEKLVASVDRDTQLQSGLSDALSKLVAEHQGQSVSEFSIRGLADAQLTEKDLAEQVTLLHFWDYRDEPLKEPYGQVGYLDFIQHRRPGLKLYGVAVDGRLAEEQTRPAAERGVRRLKEFMNLSFPVLLDSGGLLKKFGDPRVVGAALPLFVLIGRDGKIVHYHVGFYDVQQDQGLKELDDAVSAALAKKES